MCYQVVVIKNKIYIGVTLLAAGLIPDEDLGTIEIPDTLLPLNDQDLQMLL